MYFTQIHNYVFNTDTHMLEMNNVSILGILIDYLSKKTNTDTGGVHIVPVESVVLSPTTVIIQRLKSIYFLDYLYVLNCFDIYMTFKCNICEILYGWLMMQSS